MIFHTEHHKMPKIELFCVIFRTKAVQKQPRYRQPFLTTYAQMRHASRTSIISLHKKTFATHAPLPAAK